MSLYSQEINPDYDTPNAPFEPHSKLCKVFPLLTTIVPVSAKSPRFSYQGYFSFSQADSAWDEFGNKFSRIRNCTVGTRIEFRPRLRSPSVGALCRVSWPAQIC